MEKEEEEKWESVRIGSIHLLSPKWPVLWHFNEIYQKIYLFWNGYSHWVYQNYSSQKHFILRHKRMICVCCQLDLTSKCGRKFNFEVYFNKIHLWYGILYISKATLSTTTKISKSKRRGQFLARFTFADSINERLLILGYWHKMSCYVSFRLGT